MLWSLGFIQTRKCPETEAPSDRRVRKSETFRVMVFANRIGRQLDSLLRYESEEPEPTANLPRAHCRKHRSYYVK